MPGRRKIINNCRVALATTESAPVRAEEARLNAVAAGQKMHVQ